VELVVVVVGVASVVVVTLGTVEGGAPAPSERAESSDEPDVADAAGIGWGIDVVVVVVVDRATAGALDRPPAP